MSVQFLSSAWGSPRWLEPCGNAHLERQQLAQSRPSITQLQVPLRVAAFGGQIEAAPPPDHPRYALEPKRFCLARLPQIFISHQRRLLFLVVSKNNQPHSSPWHYFTRVRSACCSSVSADSEMEPSTTPFRHGVDKQPPRDRHLECHCQELRNAFAVFKSAVSKPSLKRSYTDCRRLRASAIRP
jgi:hypothetical protein